LPRARTIALAILGIVAVVGLFVAAQQLFGTTGGLLVVVLLQSLMMTGMVWTRRDQDRSLARRLKPLASTLQRSVEEALDERLTPFESELAAVRKEGRRGRTQLREQLASNRRHVDRQLLHEYRQLEALLMLRDELPVVRQLVRLRGWSASPDVLQFLVAQVLLRHPKLVVECGSGSSTVVLAAALERSGGEGKVIALEHEEAFAASTASLLAEHGLSHRAEVRHAPLQDVTIDGGTYRWYSPSAVPHGPIELLFVDGPPKRSHDQARFPALPLVHDRLSSGAMIVLDDYQREAEQAIVARWLESFPDLQLRTEPHEKGTAVLVREVR
jgi:predicted O-methyltransferase YrrM